MNGPSATIASNAETPSGASVESGSLCADKASQQGKRGDTMERVVTATVDGQVKKYDRKDGTRLTDCCAAYSAFDMDDGVLMCKKCYGEVNYGEGDGTESLPD